MQIKNLLERYLSGSKDLIQIIGDILDGHVKLASQSWALEITINEKFIGCELDVDKGLTGNIPVGSTFDTDLYPLDFDPDFTEAIKQEISSIVASLFERRLYYGSNKRLAYFARPMRGESKYILTTYKKRLLTTSIDRSEVSLAQIKEMPQMTQIKPF